MSDNGNDNKQKPICKVQYGSIKAAIWENTSNDGYLFHSFTLIRGYCDEKGEKGEKGKWYDTPSFRWLDVKDLEACLDDVFRWMRTIGRERAKEHRQPGEYEANRTSSLVEAEQQIPF